MATVDGALIVPVPLCWKDGDVSQRKLAYVSACKKAIFEILQHRTGCLLAGDDLVQFDEGAGFLGLGRLNVF